MDAATFQEQVMAIERLLYRVSWNILGNEADCADAVQEALARAWERRDTLRKLDAFRPWLTRIVVNTCNETLRKRKHMRFVPLEDEPLAEAPTNDPPPFREAMMQLPPNQRTVVVLYYLEGYTIKEVARMLGIPGGTVKTRLMAARKRLQHLLSEEWEERL